MTGSHSELRNWQFQVPKNRKVFRRILAVSLQAKTTARPETAEKRHICSLLGDNLNQGAGLTWRWTQRLAKNLQRN